MHMPLITLIVIVIAALGGAFYYRSSREEAATVPESETVIEADTQPTKEVSAYADGTYTETGTYTSPAGVEPVTISITLENGIVTDSTFTGVTTNPGSVMNQEKFAQGFKGQVVGKPIDSIALGVVNGSSLTPKGFMDALNQIKVDARI